MTGWPALNPPHQSLNRQPYMPKAVIRGAFEQWDDNSIKRVVGFCQGELGVLTGHCKCQTSGPDPKRPVKQRRTPKETRSALPCQPA